MRPFRPASCAVAMAVLGLVLVASGVRAGDPGMEEPRSRRRTLVIGHRGDPVMYPGNTMEAFRAALRSGADAVELDLCLTRDGKVVVWHDPDHSNMVAFVRETGFEPDMSYRPWVPNLLSSFRRPVHEIDLADFRREYGYTRRTSSALTGAAPKVPFRIPTLDDVAAWAARSPELSALFLDVKVPASPAGLAGRFARGARTILERAGVLDRVVFMVVDPQVLSAVQSVFRGTAARFSHDQEIVALMPDADDYSAVAAARKAGCTVASIGRPRVGLYPWSTYLDVLRRDVRDRGDLEVVAWTLNDPDEMKAVVGLGVDGIVTDRPDLLRPIVDAELSR